LLERHGIRPSRRKGQSFLVQPGIARRIALAAEIPPGASVIEVGPGLGMLTRALAPLCGRVLAIEVDGRLVRILKEEETLPENVEILEADALRADYQALVKGLRRPRLIVSNLPYAVSTPAGC
jgi:16S rRNA (adenine1518-N6/adenine1519-N6)-dimethyltransferase